MKNYLTLLVLGCSVTTLFAEMRYNPVTDTLYSYPESPEINQEEYRKLFKQLVKIYANMEKINEDEPSKEAVLEQISIHLNSIGTPTALRLLEDCQNGSLYYSNGTFIKDMWD